jgi:hypothetical protein
MALLVRKHPELRASLPLGGWAWNASHARWLLAAAGLCVLGAARPAGRTHTGRVRAPAGGMAPSSALRRRVLGAVLVAPWVLGTPRVYGTGARGLARSATELPGRFVLDGVETAALLRGSVKHGALLL